MEINLKPVDYFGHKITVHPEIKWLAVDSDGELLGFTEEPYVDMGGWNDSGLCGSYFVCDVDLQGVGWKATKQKVASE